jgi:hypothetical protein
MKTALLLIIISGFLFACQQEKEIQMSFMDVQLVKVDTVQRYLENPQQVLTWRSQNRVDYVTYEPLSAYYPIGARMKVMVRR